MNPVAVGFTPYAQEYQWSSYRAYVGVEATSEWLQTKFVLNMVGEHQQRESYRLFVEKGVDEETQTFYGKKKFPTVMGSDDFRASIHSSV